MRTKELQDEIKKLLAEMHWTQAEAARRVYYEIKDSDDADDIRRYIESFKKKLSRSTTPPEHLEQIFKKLCIQREVQKSRVLKLTYVPGPSISTDLQREMQKISRILDQK